MAFLVAEAPAKVLPGTLSFAQRVAYQRAIEDVYWRHRIWPKENPNPKPSLDAVMSQGQLEKKVEDYLLNSEAAKDYYKESLGAEQLQGEMNRMAQHTKQPGVLRELFEALSNDPFVIAECLARPVLAERMITGSHVTQIKTELSRPNVVIAKTANYTLPAISDGATGCTGDTWTATSMVNAPTARFNHTVVWTGSEMIIWSGWDGTNYFNTGAKYNPSTDSWKVTSTTNTPTARAGHTAVWTGTEMIVWGGFDNCCCCCLSTGGRYNPGTDTWTATRTTNAPVGRQLHTAVWTGTEMIVWGGQGSRIYRNGGRYNPSTDSWTDTSTTNAPTPRYEHTAVWTGSEMIVWGGTGSGSPYFNTGGRYNPNTDTWTAMSATSVPDPRRFHTAVWTGTEMIVWGGGPDFPEAFNTGGRYCAQSGAPTPTPTPTPGPIQLRGQGKKVGGINTSRLEFRGATSANVDVYRDGVVIATTANDGLYDDSTGTTGQASFTYQVCEAGISTCSNQVTVNFPP